MMLPEGEDAPTDHVGGVADHVGGVTGRADRVVPGLPIGRAHADAYQLVMLLLPYVVGDSEGTCLSSLESQAQHW